MLIVLDLTARSDHHLDSTVSWAGQQHPMPFAGVLELLAALEDAIH